MTSKNRKHARIDSLNLLSYSCFDDNQQLVGQGMGRTINVSEGGILLETHSVIETQYIMSLSIGLGDDVADIKGKIVSSKPVENDRFQTGVEFVETDKKTGIFIKKYIEAFLKQDNK